MAAIVKSSGDDIYSVGPGHIVQSWNGGAERILGYGANEVIGKQSPAMNPDTRPQMDAVSHRVLDQHETVEFESGLWRKDGVVLDVAITASPICDSSGRAETIAVVARD